MGRSKYRYLFFIILGIIPSVVNSQNVNISVDLSDSTFKAEDEVILTFSVAEEVDAYFFSAETEFDGSVLEFITVENTGLTAGGLVVAELIDNNRIGASVSRTEPLAGPAAGEIMRLTFKVKAKADAGIHSFTYGNHALINSSDQVIEHEPMTLSSFEVEESISVTSLTTPSFIEVTEGDTYFATAEVYANGVTQDSANSDRIAVWVGISNTDTDPGTWDESVWQAANFTGELNGYFLYEGEIAFQRPVGTYFVAVRSVLDTEGEYNYGGVDGNWDSTAHPNAEMVITENPPFRYTLVEWDFDDETLVPSSSLPQNDGARINTIGANEPGYATGATGRAASATGWANYDEQNPAYWLVTLSTENFESILLSSKHSGSGSGPRDFQLQVSIDGNSWSDVGSAIVMTENFSDNNLEQIMLPALADNQQELYIRWVQISDFRIDGTEGVSSVGSNRIDDIVLTGINPNAHRVEVWPGDTDNDGIVTEADVLPLSANWGLVGPPSIYDSRAWEARGVEAWIPEEATYADANGNGIVNQNDLLPVGLNFGESRSEAKQPEKSEFIDSIVAESRPAGDELEFYIHSEDKIDLSGISFRVQLDGVAESDWQIRAVEPGNWAGEWSETNRLMEFVRQSDFGVSSAIAPRGIAKPVEADLLIKVTIRAVNDWLNAPEIVLERMSVVTGRDVQRFENAYLSFDRAGSVGERAPAIPGITELLPNFPNPFNSVTTIRYNLAEDSNVRIDIYDLIGRKVATPVNRNQEAGEYIVRFDASDLSSGIYFYRLRTSGNVQTRSMVFVK